MKSKADLIKQNYIIEHLANCEYKIRELMVLSSFCFDIRLWNLKPIFQMSIKQSDDTKNCYFLDLYYPALNVAIEVDEEYHETTSQRQSDLLKEKRVKEVLSCDIFRVSFHESHESLPDKIEQIKSHILEVVKTKDSAEINWNVNEFDVSTFIQSQEKTIVVSLSKKNKLKDLTKMPLQISPLIHKLDEVKVVYLTGPSKSVAGVFNVRDYQWEIRNGNSFHNGQIDPSNPLISSGSTFHNETKNILLSPDLESLTKKKAH